MQSQRWSAGAVAAVVIGQLGCLPASTFTSARNIPQGTFEHVASLEGMGAIYESDTNLSGGVPSYGLRYGHSDRVELGGRFSPLSLEASVKVGLVRTPWFALAVAPRVTSSSGLLPVIILKRVPALYARIPLLATLQVTEWCTITPRAGIGYAVGKGFSSRDSEYGYAANEHDLHDPVLEGGGTLLFWLAPTVSLGLDGYAISSVLDNQVLTAGGGVAVLFTPSQETQR